MYGGIDPCIPVYSTCAVCCFCCIIRTHVYIGKVYVTYVIRLEYIHTGYDRLIDGISTTETFTETHTTHVTPV